MRETYLYPYSAEEACRRGEQSLWRASYLENIDCKDAIQKAVRQHYDGDHLDKKCLTEVIQEFGYRGTSGRGHKGCLSDLLPSGTSHQNIG